MEWIVAHPEYLADPRTPDPDVESLFLLGHSAGALHISTMLFLPDILPPALKSRIRGAVLVSGPYHFRGGANEFTPVLEQYFGGAEEQTQNSPEALFLRAGDKHIEALPRLYLVEAENEPGWLRLPGKDFADMLDAHPALKSTVPKVFAKGHNHLSLTWALATGEGEEWAEESVQWMKSQL